MYQYKKDWINARRRQRYKERRQEGWIEDRKRKNRNNRSYAKRCREQIFHILNQKQCQECNESDYRILQLDHINGGGHKERNRLTGIKFYLHYIKNPHLIEKTFQVLCANCHIIKHNRGRVNSP